MFRLAAIIVNFRTPDLAIDCLRSLEPERASSGLVVVIVDNSSGDDSARRISQSIEENKWCDWVQLVQSRINGGFSAGNNLGILSVHAEAYLLLNSDTIVRPGAIRSLLDAMNTFPNAGLISPRLEWPNGIPQISCFRFHSAFSELIDAAGTGLVTRLLKRFNVPLAISDQVHEPDWTSFACVLIRRSVIDSIGLLDEDYFMYYEDVDYCRRALRAGFRVMHWPEARVVHLRGGSGSVKSDVAQRRRPKRYLYESRSRFFGKFLGKTGLWTANLCWIAGRSISLLRELVRHKTPHTCHHAFFDIWINWSTPVIPSASARRDH